MAKALGIEDSLPGGRELAQCARGHGDVVACSEQYHRDSNLTLIASTDTGYETLPCFLFLGAVVGFCLRM